MTGRDSAPAIAPNPPPSMARRRKHSNRLRMPVRTKPQPAPRNAPTRANKVQNASVRFRTMFGGTVGPAAELRRQLLRRGNSTLNGHNFGYFVSGVYRRRWFFYDDGIQNKYTFTSDGVQPTREFQETRSLMEALWRAWSTSPTRSSLRSHLSFTFYWNQSGEDLTQHQVGYVDQDYSWAADLNSLYWTQRQIHAFQIQGSDHFEKLHDLRSDWLISIANTSQDEPDLRYFNFFRQPDGSFATFGNSLPEPVWPTRYYRYINEDSIWATLDNKVPIKQWLDLDGFVKFGGGFNGSQRQFSEDTFQFSGGSGWEAQQPPFLATPNNYFTAQNILYTTVTNRNGINYIFQRKFQQGLSLVL